MTNKNQNFKIQMSNKNQKPKFKRRIQKVKNDKMQFLKISIPNVQLDFPTIDENIFLSSIDSCNNNFPVFLLEYSHLIPKSIESNNHFP
jgi:hypothetical protein